MESVFWAHRPKDQRFKAKVSYIYMRVSVLRLKLILMKLCINIYFSVVLTRKPGIKGELKNSVFDKWNKERSKDDKVEFLNI